MECRVHQRLVRYSFWVERMCGKLLRTFPRPTSPESMHGRTGMELSHKILQKICLFQSWRMSSRKSRFFELVIFFWFCLKGFILEPFSTAFSWRTLEEWDGEALSGLGSREETTREFLGREKKTGSTLGWGLDLLYFHTLNYAWFYMGNWCLHCFLQCKMHFRFLPNYFDVSKLAPFFFVHQTSVSDIRYVIEETFPTCLLHPNPWLA